MHMVTLEELREDMHIDWKSQAKHYKAQWQSSLAKQAMCADHVKDFVEVTFTWDDGKQDTRKMRSDEAERLLSQVAHAVVFHGLTRDSATVTLAVRRVVK